MNIHRSVKYRINEQGYKPKAFWVDGHGHERYLDFKDPEGLPPINWSASFYTCNRKPADEYTGLINLVKNRGSEKTLMAQSHDHVTQDGSGGTTAMYYITNSMFYHLYTEVYGIIISFPCNKIVFSLVIFVMNSDPELSGDRG